MSVAQSQNGMPLSVGDYVRFTNPQAGQPAQMFGVVSAVNSGANTVSISYAYLSSGTPTLGSATGIVASTCLQMAAAAGPGNAESNRSY